MRHVFIDLSSDNYLEQPHIFGGYAGEHNETILQVKLPNRMVGVQYSGLRFDFQTSEDNKISSPLIPISELNMLKNIFDLTNDDIAEYIYNNYCTDVEIKKAISDAITRMI